MNFEISEQTDTQTFGHAHRNTSRPNRGRRNNDNDNDDNNNNNNNNNNNMPRRENCATARLATSPESMSNVQLIYRYARSHVRNSTVCRAVINYRSDY